jgi:glycosyltransferase involved in cell wall biosynthesis
MLHQGLRQRGLQADFLYLGDYVRTEPPVLSALGFSQIWPRLQGYRVIHAGTAFGAYALCLFKKHLQAILVHDMHGHGTSEMLMKLRYDRDKLKSAYYVVQNTLMEEVAIHRADYHLVVSRPLQRVLLSHGICRRRTLLLRNGVDVELFHPQETAPAGPFTVCYAGDFQVWQGVELLVKAAASLSKDTVRFRFIGFRQNLRDRRWKDKIGRTLGHRAELIDRLPQGELIERLRKADLLVLPRPAHQATAVAMPTKFAEYLALGKAVLVTEVDETAQFVRRRQCGLVSPPTAEGLAEAILRASQLDRRELAEMGKRGRRLAEEVFSWDVICDRYVRFLREIINGDTC